MFFFVFNVKTWKMRKRTLTCPSSKQLAWYLFFLIEVNKTLLKEINFNNFYRFQSICDTLSVTDMKKSVRLLMKLQTNKYETALTFSQKKNYLVLIKIYWIEFWAYDVTENNHKEAEGSCEYRQRPLDGQNVIAQGLKDLSRWTTHACYFDMNTWQAAACVFVHCSVFSHLI